MELRAALKRGAMAAMVAGMNCESGSEIRKIFANLLLRGFGRGFDDLAFSHHELRRAASSSHSVGKFGKVRNMWDHSSSKKVLHG